MLQKVYLLRSFKLKPQEQDGKQERYLCLIFTGHIYTVEKTHSDITPSLTSFLGSKKKKKPIIYIYIPLTGSSYFRFVATNINHLLLDSASF